MGILNCRRIGEENFLRKSTLDNLEGLFGSDEEKEVIIKDIGLKLYICGNLPQKEKVINELFKEKITNNNYIQKATNEFKTNQFYWIAKIYDDLSDQAIKSICNEIKEDTDEGNNAIRIEQNVILCFDSKNINKLFEELGEIGSIYHPFVIIISQEKINYEDIQYDLRKITNILLNDNISERLNSAIISRLWEIDCYYNEKGNQICRYTPENIFKTLDTNLTFYSINILLTGQSRSGKSTFVNFLSNKLMALESCKKESASQKITEYCLYLNNNSTIPSCIKLFDTPGITPQFEKKKECLNFLKDLIENKDNNMERKIHFILFFNMEGLSLEGIDEIFEFLNNCNKPILFVINKAFDDSDNGETKDIKSSISFFKQKQFFNLIDNKNYFGVNIVKSRKAGIFGVENIFKRIHKIFTEKNKFNENIDEKINKLYNYYDKIFNKPHEEQTKEKDISNYEKEVKNLKIELDNKIDMFKCMEIDKIKTEGIKSANKCRKIINLLGNISGVFHEINEDIPAISFFQAFMVKEIGEIFGFDLTEMNKEIKAYLKKVEENVDNRDFGLYNILKDDKNKTIKLNKDIIKKQLKSEIEKNREFITDLAEFFQKVRKKRMNELNFSKKQIDLILTNAICEECEDILINELNDSQGVIFWKNYMNICKQLEKDLKYFSKLKSEKVWGKKEMIIIEE